MRLKEHEGLIELNLNWNFNMLYITSHNYELSVFDFAAITEM